MSTPLLATSRITIPYAVDGVTHKVRAYSRGATEVGGSWLINSRATDANDTAWESAADRFLMACNNLIPSGTVLGTASLEVITGGVWIARSFHTLTPGSYTSPYIKGKQVTMVLRDALFHKVKIVMMEDTYATLFHSTNPVGLPSGYSPFVAPFIAGAGNPADPFNWMVGRGNQYINAAAFVAITGSYNRKIRRRRGLT